MPIDELLAEIAQQLEHAPIAVGHKLRGLDSVHALSQMVRDNTVDSPAGFAQLATVLELSASVPVVTLLLDHFPVLAGKDVEGRSTGWGAL